LPAKEERNGLTTFSVSGAARERPANPGEHGEAAVRGRVIFTAAVVGVIWAAELTLVAVVEEGILTEAAAELEADSAGGGEEDTEDVEDSHIRKIFGGCGLGDHFLAHFAKSSGCFGVCKRASIILVFPPYQRQFPLYKILTVPF
jgi:hypothetical protein